MKTEEVIRSLAEADIAIHSLLNALEAAEDEKMRLEKALADAKAEAALRREQRDYVTRKLNQAQSLLGRLLDGQEST